MEQGNIFGHDFAESFDIVLCLGLMEHIARPVELFELLARVGAQTVVIDTEISRSRSSLFEVDNLHRAEAVVDSWMVLVPSRRALIDLAGQFGFQAVPLALKIPDFAGMSDYQRQRRLAFICSRSAALEALPAEKRAPRLPWWVTSPNAPRP